VFRTALGTTPQDQQLYYLTGFCAEMLDEPEQAQEIYERGLARFVGYTVLRKQLAQLYLRNDKPDKAIEVLKPIDEVEQDVQYYLIFAMALQDKKDLDNAIKTLQKGVEVHTYNLQLFLTLASLYEKTDRYDDCVKLLEQAMTYEPESASLQNFLGYIYADYNQNLDRAETLIAAALKAEPNNYAYIDSMAWLYYRKGDIRRAYELIIKAQKLAPNDPEVQDHVQQIEAARKSQ
jgi:tetratricopeptide (TPR) repeat protein